MPAQVAGKGHLRNASADTLRQYFFWMLLASGLGFAKVLVLAQIMSPADLGSYLSVAGVAVLSGTLLSFGQIEGTTKYYPRLWLAGDHARIMESVRLIALKLGLRFLLALVATAVGLSFTAIENPLAIALIGCGLGLCTSYLALAASLLRAAENPGALQTFNLVRNGSAILLSSAAGWALGWQGALAGDVIAAAASLLQVSIGLRSILRHHRLHAVPHAQAASEVSKTGGGKLYLAYVLSSSTQLLDRGAVNLALGAAAAGGYGIVAMMFQVGQLVIGIFAQRAGPRVIKSARTSDTSAGRIESIRKPILGMLALSAAVACAVLLSMWLDLPPGFFSKYQLNWELVVLGAGVCFLQIFSLLEFHLLAHDRETEIFLASAAAALMVAVLFATAWWLGLSLEWFVASVLAARAVQTGMLWRWMNVRRHNH